MPARQPIAREAAADLRQAGDEDAAPASRHPLRIPKRAGAAGRT